MLENRLRSLLGRRRQQSYEQLRDQADVGDIPDGVSYSDSGRDHQLEDYSASPFSWLEYSILFWMGVNMLWAWNMFLAAAPYFQLRFTSNRWVMTNFQSCILSVSCVTNLSSVLILAKKQKNASYPRRITLSLILNIAVFTLLALSAILFRDVSIPIYFAFLLFMVFGASLATGFNQNGMFAYASGFGRAEYTQAIMAGQGVAGVLPCVVQIISVLAVPEQSESVSDQVGQYKSSKSAFAFFITATLVSAIAFVAFLYLIRRQRKSSPLLKNPISIGPDDEEELESTTIQPKKPVPLWTLFQKLRWMALAVYLCFAVTMAYPVFTNQIQSVRNTNPTTTTGNQHIPRLFQPSIFIPLGLLFWNSGDLVGRLIVLIPQINLTHRPILLFLLSIARLVFIPLYMLCNINGRGAWINSDVFYLVIVQFLFGMSNGYIGGACMMGAAEWVAVEEREAAGGFMSFMLVAGLTSGSLLSFLVAS
ncbi:solute carrier family 29 (equilibrative nucleoside transporter), member 1/2/3 [[Emmonsia] crescens]|uniref:Solute carrier family 29 (Equilibrative nucleoside transporter), member 1/2/3 n=1 Tax=[Emmonsia] crescens TaxID=73230 RepID=A0A2B7ZD47_9EURO|nr:solute carrier family 29 (equilibrative nucleoside transporter), member 1/2/3 [Emmonsia crescens]